jgi:predicted nucleic acid-binding protein
MKIYLDACCLNRPFDDQSQVRIHLESESILQIMEFVKKGNLTWMKSDILEYEIDSIEDIEKRNKIISFYKYSSKTIEINDEIISISKSYEKLGFGAMDSIHIASAISAKIDVFLTTDDKLEKIGKKNHKKIGIKIDNPLNWIQILL